MNPNFSNNHQEYIERNKLLAKEKAFSGKALLEWHKATVYRNMIEYFGPTQWLDYGCGPAYGYREHGELTHMVKGTQSQQPVLYDPCHPPFDTFPTIETIPGVICVDVLEHIPESDIEETLKYLFNVCSQWMFLFISTKRGARNFPNSHESTHCTLKTRQEWVDIVKRHVDGKQISVVLSTDYVNDTFDHSGKGFTYDHWNMPVELVENIKKSRQDFIDQHKERAIDQTSYTELYNWELKNSNFEI